MSSLRDIADSSGEDGTLADFGPKTFQTFWTEMSTLPSEGARREDEAGGASVDLATGKLIWNLHLESNEERKLQFSFTVKYPKDQVIPGL